MKYILLATLVCFTTTATYADVIAFQSFETTPPANEWSFTPSPVTYNTEGDPIVSGSEDVWAAIETFTAPGLVASEGSQFWGIQDITNGFASGDHFLNFDNIDISGETGVTLKFDYNAINFDSNDELSYQLIYDNVQQGEVFLVGGTGSGTSGWVTETISIPDSVNLVALQLIALQDGATDYAGFDNVLLSSAIPEPGSLMLIGFASLTLGGYTLVRRQSQRTKTPAN